jgi:2-keto-4-pentenoate hydratase/2-oxohepta-3-ene-1,7-dioic acid hydratase in catechol pathway
MNPLKPIPDLSDLNVQNIYCIGRNYAKHAEELNNAVPDEPVVFIKPDSSITYNKAAIVLPEKSSNVHHEVELVVAIGREGKHISTDHALSHVAGYGIGIDVTARDIQQRAKDRSHPWAVAKGFDTFAPISSFVSADSVTDPQALELKLTVNNQIRQHGFTKDMLFPVAETIAYLSSIFTLQPGDLIFTGTPEGVSAIQDGDRILAELIDPSIKLNLLVRSES